MRRRRSREADADLDFTPLIDVVFLLLVFFMVSTTFIREARLNVELPEAATSASSSDPVTPIEVLISRDGTFAVGDQRLTSSERDAIEAALRRALGGTVEQPAPSWPPLVVVADAGAAHEHVVRAMDVAGEIGFGSVRIATRRTEQRGDGS